jgi:methylenetetrahydrofolate reductase (NADPH)
LRSGQFAVTAELNPPDSADANDVYRAATILENVCDSINVTDASGAHCHMSSVAMCALIIKSCCEPVFQVSCRDRNRIAIQGDLLGAAAMGVRNVLCLTGDDVTVGDQPEAKRVFDLDSIQLLRTARIMCDQSKFLSGRPISTPPQFFLGAASNPFAEPHDWRPLRLAKKIEAGADFIQTQYCFDVARFDRFMERIRELGLHHNVFILVGVGPLRSIRAAEYLRTKVPGVYLPQETIDRLRQVPAARRQREGKRICVEIIQQVREIKGVAGVHVMAYRQEELVAEIIEEAGLMPRPARPIKPELEPKTGSRLMTQ